MKTHARHDERTYARYMDENSRKTGERHDERTYARYMDENSRKIL